MGFTVAIIGPDGAGKTTVCGRVAEACPLPVRYLYMGVSRDSSNRMLPTTRFIHMVRRMCGARPDNVGPKAKDGAANRPRGLIRRTARGLKSFVSLGNRLCEEWYRQIITWSYQIRGYLVLFDRHFFVDYYAYDIAQNEEKRPLSRRLHGALLKHFYPKPHLVIYLDAPAELLFARKGEGSVELLEERRHDYLQMADVFEHFEVVDASQPLENVSSDVLQRIVEFKQRLTGEPRRSLHETCN